MFIPTQEQRYSKRTLVTLILCVIAPSLLYAYFKSSSFSVPVDSIAGMMNLLLFFTYPLALLFIKIGVPALSWSVFHNFGGVICSLLVHAVLISLIYRNKKLSAKKAITYAMILGCCDLLAARIIGAV